MRVVVNLLRENTEKPRLEYMANETKWHAVSNGKIFPTGARSNRQNSLQGDKNLKKQQKKRLKECCFNMNVMKIMSQKHTHTHTHARAQKAKKYTHCVSQCVGMNPVGCGESLV